MFYEIRKELLQLAEADYKNFSASLIPGVERFLGIRLPKLRQMTKRIQKEGRDSYLIQYWDEVNESPDGLYFEEDMLCGMLIATGKMPLEERREELNRFVSRIHNWSVCDSCCVTCKFMKRDQEYWYGFLLEQLERGEEFSIRFGLVNLLDHFVNEAYVDRVLKECEKMNHPGYYAKMAAAWAVSVCFAKYPETTEQFLKQNRMDDWVQNKSIQKIRESYRVDKEAKDRILAYRR